MKVAIITDTHFGKANDSLIHDNYFARFYNDIFFPTLKARDIKRVLHLGDLYDRRRFINFDILSRSRKYFLDPISDYETDFVMGNHDIYHNETSALNSPYLLTDYLDRFYISNEASETQIGSLSILLVPWINKNNHDRVLDAITRSKARVAMGHLDLHGFEMDKGQVNKHGLDIGLFKKFERVYSGHFHHKNGDVYLGAPYEMTWADCDDPKGFHVLDTETLDLEFIRNPYTLYKKFNYDDVNRLDEIQRIIDAGATDFSGKFVKIYIDSRTNHEIFDGFHRVIRAAGVNEISVIDKVPEFVIHSKVKAEIGNDIDIKEAASLEDTGKIISSYVSAAKFPAHISRDRVHVEMDLLYKEASQMSMTA